MRTQKCSSKLPPLRHVDKIRREVEQGREIVMSIKNFITHQKPIRVFRICSSISFQVLLNTEHSLCKIKTCVFDELKSLRSQKQQQSISMTMFLQGSLVSVLEKDDYECVIPNLLAVTYKSPYNELFRRCRY